MSTKIDFKGTLEITNWPGWYAEYRWDIHKAVFTLRRHTSNADLPHLKVTVAPFFINVSSTVDNIITLEAIVMHTAKAWLEKHIKP